MRHGVVEPDRTRWAEYYHRTSDRPPRPLFEDAVARFPAPGFAIDIGCGSGVETAALLARGWRVLALDAEPSAIEHVLAKAPADPSGRLETAVVPLEQVDLPPADFVWSGLTLSFCAPASFDELWTKILNALRPGGRLACDLFGARHVWAKSEGMTTFTRQQVEALIRGLDVEVFQETEGERETAFQGMQHWHGFDIIGTEGTLSAKGER